MFSGFVVMQYQSLPLQVFSKVLYEYSTRSMNIKDFKCSCDDVASYITIDEQVQ